MSTNLVGHSNTIIELTLGAAGALEGCISCTAPQPTLDLPQQFAWSGDGKPTNINGSAKIAWSDATVTFLGTQEAFNKAHTKLVACHDNPDTAKDTYVITLKTKDGQPIRTINCKDALVTSVTQSDHDANGSQFLTGTITIRPADVEIT